MRSLPLRTLFRLLLPAVVACALLPVAARAQSQPSLAEQAAAARGNKAAASLDPKIAGQMVAGEYHNDFFGLAIKPLPGWETLNRGQMNVDEAVGRDLIGLRPGLDANGSSRVFGMHDGLGSSVFLAVEAVPAGESTEDLEGKLEQVLKTQLPQIRFQREPVLLGDSGRRFAGLRLAYTFRGIPIAQTLEFIPLKGYIILVVVTTGAPEKLTAIMHDLQPRLQWTGAAGN